LRDFSAIAKSVDFNFAQQLKISGKANIKFAILKAIMKISFHNLRQGGNVIIFVCLFVCLSVCWQLRKNSQTDLQKTSMGGWQLANEQVVKLWRRSGSSSGYRNCFPDSSLLGDTESG